MGKIAKMFDVSGVSNVQNMLEVSQTNWDIEGREAGGGFTALVRPDNGTPLAFVGERYRTNSHREQLYALDTFVRNGDLLPVTVSSWDNGAILAYQFQVPALDITVHDSDRVSPLLTLAFAYGFKLADTAFFSDFRWFCKNQLGKVAELSAGYRVKHRGNVKSKYADMLGNRLTELKSDLADRYKAMRGMTTKLLGGRNLHNYIGQSLGCTDAEIVEAYVKPTEDLRRNAAKIPEVLDCYLEDDCGAPGTVWQAFNAVTRYESHHTGRTVESRLRRNLLGPGQSVASKAFELAVSV